MFLNEKERKDLEETQMLLTMVQLQNDALDDEAERSLQFCHGMLYKEEEFQYEYIAGAFRKHFNMSVTSQPNFMSAEYITKTRTVQRNGVSVTEKFGYWESENSFLNDGDASQPNSYRAVYRMNRECFDHLLNELSTHPDFNQNDPEEVPVVIQLATALFRMSFCHSRFTQAHSMLQDEGGSNYVKYTKRTIKAVKDKLGHLVSWPSVPANATEGGEKQPPRCAGIIEEKNFSIHYPSAPEKGGMLIKRAGSSLMKLTVICDADEKFIYANLARRAKVFNKEAEERRFYSQEVMGNPKKYFPDRSYMIGSSKLPFHTNVMTLIDEEEAAQNPKKKVYNEFIASQFVAMYRALGALDARWKFHGTDLYSYDEIDTTEIIKTCITLHNMCVNKGDMGFVELNLDLD